ncbi:Thioesterase superfamily protein [Ceratocystis platani]|uniref:Thioesterase superfamily protein n=1 Tax=Ceratocystis fimbriata f. sp. platani TaxID=88771 RepID=A0A0F8CTT7_CERFI|nr:Thioesterase superfamily protein [Ceratocystis platani]
MVSKHPKDDNSSGSSTPMTRSHRCFWGKTVDDKFAAWFEEPEPDEEHAQNDFACPLLKYSSLFDVLTGITLLPVQRLGFWEFLGVSRSLNVTYLRPAFAGEVLTIDCEVVSVGQRLAHIKGTMRNAKDEIIAMVAHDKANVDKVSARPYGKL